MEKRAGNTRPIPMHGGAILVCSFLVMGGIVLGCERLASEPARDASSPVGVRSWIVDPSDPGPDLPDVGRSLFDHVIGSREGGARGYDVPFPLSALIDKIERAAGLKESRNGLRRLLIPVNRSLQRRAAVSDWFAYPRAVVAVDREPSAEAGVAGLNLKDRLFLGYHEKANVLEVISYNEAAGRFEFQVVRDYRADGRPTVRYANRALCTACHQNQGPIFSRPLWEETNANVKVAAMLAGQRRNFYGFPTHVGIGVPQAFDEATDRANAFSAAQWLWRDGCEAQFPPGDSVQCRADLARLMLSYELSGRRLFAGGMLPNGALVPSQLATGWRARWPNGIALPNPDIPNRNPFTVVSVSSFPGLTPVDAGGRHGPEPRSSAHGPYEPTMLRDPLEWWSPPESAGELEWAIAQLSRFLTQNDVRRLDTLLVEKAREHRLPHREYEASCQVEGTIHAGESQLRFRCGADGDVGSLSAEATADRGGVVRFEAVVDIQGGQVTDGEVEELQMYNHGVYERMAKLRVVDGTSRTRRSTALLRLDLGNYADRMGREHTPARTSMGDAIQGVRLEWSRRDGGGQAQPGRLIVSIRPDGTLLDSAWTQMVEATRHETSDVFAKAPFRRVSFLDALEVALQVEPVHRCCLEDRRLPPPVADAGGSAHTAGNHNTVAFTEGPSGLFHRYCATCHHGQDAFPPNFLQGTPDAVERNLRHCAERIAVRLSMWEVDGAHRQEAPMPPATEVLRHRFDLTTWTAQHDYRLLVRHVRQWISERPGSQPQLGELLHQDYESLPACLPERTATERLARVAALP